jgi:excisionase family DNA binding protein
MKRTDIDLLESALGHLIAGLEDIKAFVASLEADDEREESQSATPDGLLTVRASATPQPKTKSDSAPNLITVKQAAGILRCHRDTVYAMLARGELAETRVGRRRLIDAESLPQPARAQTPIIPPAKPRQMTGELVDAVARIRGAA